MRLLPSLLLAVLLAVAGACRSAAPELPLPSAEENRPAPPGPASTMGPGDMVEVRVFQEPDHSGVWRVSPEGTIDYPIPKSEDGPRVDALTRFRLVAQAPAERCSLVLALPETGRLHQVRRHLRHAGHPLIGDVKYGSGELNRHYRARYGLHRLALHAVAVRFEHPATLSPVTVTAPVPDDLARALELLGLPTAAPD